MKTGRTNSKQPAYPVGSVENALRLLAMLRDRPSIRVAEAATELSVARSTAHRLLAMLNAYEVVTQDPESRAYGPGPLLTELGLASLRHDNVITALHPFLEELSETVNETVHLFEELERVRSAGYATYVVPCSASCTHAGVCE